MLHRELLTLLLDKVGTVQGNKLLLDVLQKRLLLFLGQAFILVALLDLFLALFNALTQVGCICIELLLHLLLAPEHVVEVTVLVFEIILVLVLHSLLLKVDVAESAFLILLLLPLVLVKGLFVSTRLTIGQSLVTDQLHSHLALLGGHLGAEVHLLRSVLLFQLFLERGLFVLVGVAQLEVDFSKEVFFVQTQILQRVLVSLLRHGLLQLFKLIFVNLEVLLDGVILSMLLIRVLVEHKLEQLFLLSELLH